RLDELVIDIRHQTFENLSVRGREWTERGADVFVLRALHHLHVHADLFHQRTHFRVLHDHADRAGDRAREREDRVGGEGDVVAAGSANGADGCDHGDTVFPESLHFAIKAL